MGTLVITPSSNWSDNNPKGFKYKDRGAIQDGVQQIKLLPGTINKTKAMIKARGVNVPMPIPVSNTRYFNQSSEVIVQLSSTSGVCWTSTFTAADTKKNRPSLFSATAR